MIRLQRVDTGFFLDTAGVKVTLRGKSPFFQTSSIPGIKTFPFRLKSSPVNIAQLKYGNLVQTAKFETSVDVNLWIGGSIFSRGKLDVIQRGNASDFDCSFRCGAGAITEYKDTSIRKFGYTDSFFFEAFRKFKYEFIFVGGGPYTYEITFGYTGAAGYREFAVAYANGESMTAFLTKIADKVQSFYTTDRVWAEVRSGYLYIFKTYEWGFNFSISESESTTELSFTKTTISAPGIGSQFYEGGVREHMKAVAQSNADEYKYTFFPVYNPKFFNEENASYNDYINFFYPSNTASTAQFEHSSVVSPCSPYPYLYSVFKEIITLLGYNLENSLFDDELKTIAIYNTFDNSIRWKTASVNTYSHLPVFNIGNCLPNIPLTEFMNAIQNLFSAVMDFNSLTNKMRIISRKDILKKRSSIDWSTKVEPTYTLKPQKSHFNLNFTFDSADELTDELLKPIEEFIIADPVDEIGDLPVIGNVDNTLRLVKSENKYYLVLINDSGNDEWVLYSHELYGYDSGETGAENIQPAAAPVFSENREHVWSPSYKINWHVPVAKQQGNAKYFTASDSFSFRLAFYRGFQPAVIFTAPSTSFEANYPMASNSNRNYKNDVIGNYTLKWNGAGGLQETFWAEPMEYFKQATPFEFRVNVTPEDLQRLDVFEKIHAYNCDWLIDEWEVTVGDTLSTMKVTAWRK